MVVRGVLMRRRYIGVGPEWVPIENWHQPEPVGPLIMPDIKPYKSMVTGEMITSRSRHREHLRQHGVIEVGNELDKGRLKRPESPPGLKETIIRLANEKLR